MSNNSSLDLHRLKEQIHAVAADLKAKGRILSGRTMSVLRLTPRNETDKVLLAWLAILCPTLARWSNPMNRGMKL